MIRLSERRCRHWARFGRRGSRVWARALVAGVLGMGCWGCGAAKTRLYPAQGQILIAGQPAAGALVVFHSLASSDPAAINPYAIADEQGMFRLGTHKTGDGAPQGDYAVTVQWRRPKGNPFEKDGPDRLQGRYSSPEKTPLRAHVDPKPTELAPFRLP